MICRHLIRDDVAVQGRRNLWAGTIPPLDFEIREVENAHYIIVQPAFSDLPTALLSVPDSTELTSRLPNWPLLDPPGCF